MNKIWIINHYATEMYRDKSGRHYWFAKKLETKEYYPTIFCASTFHNNLEYINLKGLKYCIKFDENTPFVFVKTRSSINNGFDRIRNIFGFYLNLFTVVKKYANQYGKPNIILASSVHPLSMIAGIKIAKKFKIPCICEIRDLWPEALFTFGLVKEKSIIGRILTAGEHWIYKKADALIFTKEGDTDYLKEKKWTTEQGGDINLTKCHYINNGVNISIYEKQIKNDVIDDDDFNSNNLFNIIYTGTIRPINNIGNLIDCARLLKKYTNIIFLIYGEGNQLLELKKRIVAEKINNIHLKGFVERKYIPYILSKSSVNILNYSQNQFNWTRGISSNKLFEYMASGKPIISTVQMGYSIINKYKCGIELFECTPKALADAILQIYNMPQNEYEELGLNAKKGSADFDFNILTDKLINVIMSIKKC